MNCVVFHNKTNELLEDDCLIDIKDSMKEHKDNCKECQDYYEEELKINNDFKQFFSAENIEFKSSRVEIMNVINKNKYKNNYLIQAFTNFNRNKRKYVTWAAVFTILLVLTPNIYKLIESSNIGFSMSKASLSTASQNTKFDQSLDNAADSSNLNNITFEKVELPVDDKIVSKAIWKISDDGRYSACIQEGIYVKENKTGKLWSFTINDNLNQQIKPIFIDWYQKDSAFVIKMESLTGVTNEYLLNLDSAKASLIINTTK